MLLDSGCSHKFCVNFTRKLNLPIQQIQNIIVIVVKGQFIECVGVCLALQLQFNDYELCVDFYLLELDNVDVVLGISWLQTLEPILWDFAALCMSFMVKGPSHISHDHKIPAFP